MSLHRQIFKNLLQHSYHSAHLSTKQQNRKKKEKVLLLYVSLQLSLPLKQTTFTAIDKLYQGTLSLSPAMQREILEKRKTPFLINPIIIFSSPALTSLPELYME